MDFRVGLVFSYSAVAFGTLLAQQPPYLIQTIAGSAFVGDEGPARSASLAQAEGLAAAKSGDVYIADAVDHRIRVVRPDGKMQTFAGTGSAGFAGDGGPAGKALFNSPYGVSVDQTGNLFVADLGNKRIRRISADGLVVTTVAGGGTVSAGPAADGGPATGVRLEAPRNVLADRLGGFYFSDFAVNRVYYVDRQGMIQTFAGNGSILDIPLRSPAGLTFDPQGALLIADSGNNLIRRVFRNAMSVYSHSPNRLVPLYSPTDIAFDVSGNLYIADDRPAMTLRRAVNGDITSISAGGRSLAVDEKGTAYVASGGLVRAITTDVKNNRTVSFFAGNGGYGFAGDEGSAASARLNGPSGINYDFSGNLYIADERNHRVRKVSPQGVITTVAGLGNSGYAGDGGLATDARLNAPRAVTVDRFGYVYIAEAGNHTIRRITPSGFISTIAGDGTAGYRGDGGVASSARLREPSALAINEKGELFVADKGNGAVRKILAPGLISTEVEGLSSPQGLCVDAEGRLLIAELGRVDRLEANGRLVTMAAVESPSGIAVSKDGSLFVSDQAKHRILKFSGGTLTIVAGIGSPGLDGDGGLAVLAQLNTPAGLLMDSAGALLVADTGNHRIRKLFAGALPAEDVQSPFSIVKAVSNQAGALVPGELMLLYSAVPMLSPELLFNGLPAALVYQSKTQLNAVVPKGLPVKVITAELRDGGQTKGQLQVEIVASAPALFRQVLNEDGLLNSAGHAAPRLSLLTVFATGFDEADAVTLALSGKPILLSTEAIRSDGVSILRFRVPAGFLASGQQTLQLTVGTLTAKALEIWIE